MFAMPSIFLQKIMLRGAGYSYTKIAKPAKIRKNLLRDLCVLLFKFRSGSAGLGFPVYHSVPPDEDSFEKGI